MWGISKWLKTPWERAWNKKAKESRWPAPKPGESPTEYINSMGLEAKQAVSEASVLIFKGPTLVAKVPADAIARAQSYADITRAIKEALERGVQ